MNISTIPRVPGVLKITHTPTGCFYFSLAENLYEAATSTISTINSRTHHSPRLNELVKDLSEVELTYETTTSREEARELRWRRMREHYASPLILNNMDWPKLPGAFVLTHIPTGRFIIGHTQDLAKQNNYQRMMLRTGKHKNREFQEIVGQPYNDQDIRFSMHIAERPEDAKTMALRLIEEASHNPLFVARKKGVVAGPDDTGVYIIKHRPTGSFYVGSAKKLKDRAAHHRWQLKTGRHKNRQLQALYTGDLEEFEFTFIETPTRKAALKLEQELIDKAKDDPLFLNLAKDARSSISSITFSEAAERAIAENRKRRHTDHQVRAKAIRGIREYWSRPESREKRSGGGNPFAKQVMVGEVCFGSVVEAARALGVSNSKLSQLARDPHCEDVYFPDLPIPNLEAHNQEVLQCPTRKARYEEIIKQFGGNQRARPLMLDGTEYPSMRRACNQAGISFYLLQQRLENPRDVNAYYLDSPKTP